MRRRLIALSGTALLVLLFAACGGDDDKPETSATQSAVSSTATAEPEATDSGDDTGDGGSDELIDACTLLTESEVAAAVGDVTQGDVTYDDPTSSCFWYGNDEYMTSKVELVLYQASDQADLDNIYFGTGQEISDVGDQAVWLASFGILETTKGLNDLTVTITQTTDMTDDQTLAIAKDMAQKALDRLP